MRRLARSALVGAILCAGAALCSCGTSLSASDASGHCAALPPSSGLSSSAPATIQLEGNFGAVVFIDRGQWSMCVASLGAAASGTALPIRNLTQSIQQVAYGFGGPGTIWILVHHGASVRRVGALAAFESPVVTRLPDGFDLLLIRHSHVEGGWAGNDGRISRRIGIAVGFNTRGGLLASAPLVVCDDAISGWVGCGGMPERP